MGKFRIKWQRAKTTRIWNNFVFSVSVRLLYPIISLFLACLSPFSSFSLTYNDNAIQFHVICLYYSIYFVFHLISYIFVLLSFFFCRNLAKAAYINIYFYAIIQCKSVTNNANDWYDARSRAPIHSKSVTKYYEMHWIPNCRIMQYAKILL